MPAISTAKAALHVVDTLRTLLWTRMAPKCFDTSNRWRFKLSWRNAEEARFPPPLLYLCRQFQSAAPVRA